MNVCPAKTQISLGIRPVWSESPLCAEWVAKDPSFLYVDCKDSDQTGQMPRLIWVFAGHTVILLVLLWGGSNEFPSTCSTLRYSICESFVTNPTYLVWVNRIHSKEWVQKPNETDTESCMVLSTFLHPSTLSTQGHSLMLNNYQSRQSNVSM